MLFHPAPFINVLEPKTPTKFITQSPNSKNSNIKNEVLVCVSIITREAQAMYVAVSSWVVKMEASFTKVGLPDDLNTASVLFLQVCTTIPQISAQLECTNLCNKDLHMTFITMYDLDKNM